MVSDEISFREEQLENFRYLTCDDRVNYVMKQAAYFGYYGIAAGFAAILF